MFLQSFESLASLVTLFRFDQPRSVERFHGFLSAVFLRITEHVHGDSVVDVFSGADPIDRFLHLAVTAVAPLHGVGCGGQQVVVKKRQRLVQVGRAKLVQYLGDFLKTANTLTELGQLRQRRVGVATTIEQMVHFFHEGAQRAQQR